MNATSQSFLVSIIVPCYNQGCFLVDTLNSIISQTYGSWECIIINDGSTDNTEEIAQKYCDQDARFRYIKTANSGLSASRNNGIKAAKGHFIQLLDADDLIEPDKLKMTVETFRLKEISNVEAIVYSSMRYFDHDVPDQLKILGTNHFLAHVELKITDHHLTQLDLIKARNLCVISAPVYPRALFDKIGFFDEHLTSLEDWDFHIRCLTAGFKFHHHYAYNALTLIRLHDSSMMRNQKRLDENFYKLILKHDLQKVEEPVKQVFSVKRIIKEITPPIVFKWASYFINHT